MNILKKIVQLKHHSGFRKYFANTSWLLGERALSKQFHCLSAFTWPGCLSIINQKANYLFAGMKNIERTSVENHCWDCYFKSLMSGRFILEKCSLL